MELISSHCQVEALFFSYSIQTLLISKESLAPFCG